MKKYINVVLVCGNLFKKAENTLSPHLDGVRHVKPTLLTDGQVEGSSAHKLGHQIHLFGAIFLKQTVVGRNVWMRLVLAIARQPVGR